MMMQQQRRRQGSSVLGPPTTFFIMLVSLLLSSYGVVLIDAISSSEPDVSISNNNNIDCTFGNGDDNVNSPISESDCAIAGLVMTCPADMTCTSSTTDNSDILTTKFEGEIECDAEGLAEANNIIDASQQDLCQCGNIKINDVPPPPDASCDCFYCDSTNNPTMTVPVSYQCLIPIVDACLGIDCYGNCILQLPDGNNSSVTSPGANGTITSPVNTNGTITSPGNNNNNNHTNPEQGNMTTEYVVTDLTMAAANANANVEPYILFEVLPTNDERHFLIHVPDQSEVYMIQFESSQPPSVNTSSSTNPSEQQQSGRQLLLFRQHQQHRSLQTTTCPPPQDGATGLLTTFNEETNTTTVELDLDGQDTEIVICSKDNEVLANYFVAYENGDTTVENGGGGSTPVSGGGNNAMEPDYTTTYDFINMVDNNGTTASYEVQYGPGAPDGQNGTGWIVLAGDLVWYESTTNIKIGDVCPVENNATTLIPSDPNFPFTLYEHDGMDPPQPEVLHGCDPTQTTVVGEILFVYVEPPTMAPVQAPVLPPTSFKQDCTNFNISLPEGLESSCENYCSPGTFEVFDFAAPKSEGSNQIDRNSVCRCCNDEGPCQNETTLQSKWECWTTTDNVWDLSTEIQPCSEMEIASQTQCQDYCFVNIDGYAWEFDSDGDVEGKPVCKCADYTVCGVEPDDDDGGLSTGALIGIIVGALLLLCCCLLLLFLLCCRKKDEEKEEDEEYDEDVDDRYVDPEEGYDDDDDSEPKLALGYDEEESDEDEEDSDDEEESDDDEPRLALTNGSDDDDDDSEEESGSEEESDSEEEDSDEFEDE